MQGNILRKIIIMLDRDFTLSKFKELCEEITLLNYQVFGVRNYLKLAEVSNKFIIIRHDIDGNLDIALKMAEIECEYNINSTYYVRMIDSVFQPAIIRKFVNMGHEVGYHYEVLDKAKGNKNKAIEIFKEELSMLRNVCDVDTICMHGNPRTPWDNKDIWKDYQFKDFDIIGEPYLSIDFKNILYLSDTGRNWGSKYKVKDTVGNICGKETLRKINSTNDVIRLLQQRKYNRIFFLSHPRWNDEMIPWIKELIWQDVKNVVKARILSRDYNGNYR